MTVLERNIQEAVASAESLRWISAYLKGALDTGNISVDELATILEHVYQSFLELGDERASNLVLDALDLLTGWCGPEMQISAPHAA